MTTQTTTIGRKQGFRSVLVMTAATAALLGGVVLFQFRPNGEATAPTTPTHSRASDGLTQVREPASPYHEEPQGSKAELSVELQAGAGTGSVTATAVGTQGGMVDPYREQRAVADQRLARDTCGENVQPVTC